MKTKSHATLTILAAFILPGVVRISVAQDAEQERMLEYLVQGGASHRESIPFLQSTLTITNGWAADWETGIEGVWLGDRDKLVETVQWSVDGNTTFRERKYDADDVRKHTYPEKGFATVANLRVIWNDTLHILYFPGEHFHITQGGRSDFDGWNLFNVGMAATFHKRSPVLQEKRGKQAVRYVGERDIDGVQYPVLEFEAENQLDRYWIDPSRGFTPIRIECYYGDDGNKERLVDVYVVKEFQELSGNRWVPSVMRMADYTQQPTPVTEVKLVEIDADNKPPKSALMLDVGAGTVGFNKLTGEQLTAVTGKVGLSHFQADGRLVPDQTDLVLKSEQPTATFPSTVPTAASTSTTRQLPRIWFWSILTVGLALLAIAAILARLRQTPAATKSQESAVVE